MARIVPFAVTVGLVALAAGIAGLVRLFARVEPATAFSIGIGVLFIAFVAVTGFQRAAERQQLQSRLEGLAQLEEVLARTLQTLPARVTALEERAARRAAGEPAVLKEVDRLAVALGQLGQTVEAIEKKLERPRPVVVDPAAEPATVVQPLPATPPEPRWPEPDPAGRIRRAVEAERIDIFLQPIITLPQRRPLYYDASVQLRDDGGQPMAAADYAPRAERAGLAPRLDNLILFRAIQVLRRLAIRHRETALFCPLSGRTLADAAGFAEFAGFLAANRPMAEALVLVLPQKAQQRLGGEEADRLAELRRLGCRLCLGEVTDLRLDGPALAEAGFRFVKVAAALLLDRNAASRAGLLSGQLSERLARAGIDLIGERIAAEATVVDLLDQDVRFGEGDLFARPRPVRPDVVGAAPPPAEGAA